MSKRCIMRIKVLPEVLETLTDATEQVGSTQVSVISRLLEWFVKQSERNSSRDSWAVPQGHSA
jgi:hypothetical protein